MWILLLEVGEESTVGEGLQSRGIISHVIDRAWEVGDLVAVAIFTLVGTGFV